MVEPFQFKTSLRLIQLLGIKAKTLQELLDNIKIVPTSSIYYHTHRLLYQQFLLYPEPPNDFAYWISQSLNIKDLGEAVASINIIHFRNIETLRKQLIKIISDYIVAEKPNGIVLEGQEFHFMKCQTFILPTAFKASSVDELCEVLKRISLPSLYFHFIESRLRLNNSENDFSRWLFDLGEKKVAIEIARLDPYTITLEGLRHKLIATIKKYASH